MHGPCVELILHYLMCNYLCLLSSCAARRTHYPWYHNPSYYISRLWRPKPQLRQLSERLVHWFRSLLEEELC